MSFKTGGEKKLPTISSGWGSAPPEFPPQFTPAIPTTFHTCQLGVEVEDEAVNRVHLSDGCHLAGGQLNLKKTEAATGKWEIK